MARFMVKASEYKNVCKAVNDKKLAELKKEIVEILKKQDEKEFKKAVDLFESQEIHYSHLEKSITGKWVEKAGYGVGTVRIWKGKKYKKIAPGKWARVFDKEGRGTNIAIGKLIAKVQKIDNVEDLMALVMANKQRFVDENGVDLPVLDKLRAAVDAKNGNVGSKGSSLKTEKKPEKNSGETYDDGYKVISEDETFKKKLKNGEMTLESLKEVHKQGVENGHETQEYADGVIQAAKDILKENKTELKETSKPAEKKEGDSDIERAKDKIKQYAGKKINSNEIKDINILDDGSRSGFLTFEFKSGSDKYRMTYDSGFGGEKGGASIKKIGSEESEAEKKELSMKEKVLIATDEGSKKELGRGKMYKKHITEIQKIANSNINDIPENLKTINDFIKYQDSMSNPDYKQAGKDYARLKNHELAREIWQKVEDGEAEWDENGYLKLDENGLLAKPEKKEESKQKTLSEKIKVSEELSNNHQKAVEKVIEEVKKELGAEKTERGLTYKNSYSGDFKNYKGGDLGRSYHSMINGASKVESDYNGKPINYLTHDIEWSNSKNIDEYIDKLQERYDKKLKERKEHGIWNTNHAYWGEILEDAIKLQALKDIRDNGLLLTKEEINSYEDEIKAESERKEKESKRINTVIDYYEEESETNPNLDKKELVKIYDAIENGEDTSKFNQHDVEGMAAFMGVDLKKVKKSFDDQFLLDMAVEDEIQKVEEEQEEESLFDDYSAEQPGLFNSTAMKVREAMNRCNIL